MRRFLTATLAILIASSACVRSAIASNGSAEAQVATLKVQSHRMPFDTALTVTPENKRTVESHSEAALTPFTEAVAVNDAESEDVAAAPQATPTSNPTLPAHHTHHVRNFVIFAAVLFALSIAFAIAAGKS